MYEIVLDPRVWQRKLKYLTLRSKKQLLNMIQFCTCTIFVLLCAIIKWISCIRVNFLKEITVGFPFLSVNGFGEMLFGIEYGGKIDLLSYFSYRRKICQKFNPIKRCSHANHADFMKNANDVDLSPEGTQTQGSHQ